jgi:hypothetical protein
MGVLVCTRESSPAAAPLAPIQEYKTFIESNTEALTDIAHMFDGMKQFVRTPVFL